MKYDSDNKFNYSELLTDKKYRSRLILAIYAILFIILIVFIRGGSSSNKDFNNNILNTTNEIGNNGNNTVIDDSLDKQFSYIAGRNFNYVYTFHLDNDKYITTGKKHGNNEIFKINDVKNNLSVEGAVISGVVMKKEDNNYIKIPDYPYQYINYFNVELVNKLLENAVKVNNDLYEISNINILKYSTYDSNKLKDNGQENVIELVVKNNIIVGIKIDITNFVKSVTDEQVNSVKIVLEYNDFNLVDEINFDM